MIRRILRLLVPAASLAAVAAFVVATPTSAATTSTPALGVPAHAAPASTHPAKATFSWAQLHRLSPAQVKAAGLAK